MVNRRPNIVVLMADQHRHDVLGCAGDPVIQTPNIDRLANEGVRFTNTYCQGPLCMPARTSFITERYVRDHGVENNDWDADPTAPTFLKSLRDVGYSTTCIGKMHLWVHGGRRPRPDGSAPARDTRVKADQMRAYGFTEPIETVGKLATGSIGSEYTDHLAARDLLDTYRRWVRDRAYSYGDGTTLPNWATGSVPIPTEDYIDRWHGDRAVRWIDERGSDDPFFLWVGFPGPHDPWDAPADYVARYDAADMPLPGSLRRPEPTPHAPRFDHFLDWFVWTFSDSEGLDDDRIRDVRHHYYANVTLIDEAVGAIRDALERRGVLDDTWIIYTSDHGEMLGEHRMLMKMVFYDAATKVPMVVRPPAGCAPRVVDHLVEQVDLAATLRNLGGGAGHKDFEGRSLLTALDDSGAEFTGRDVVWSENFGMAMLRTERWKMCIEEDGVVAAQLFDLDTDPLEEHNLSGDPDHATVIEELMELHARPFLANGRTKFGPGRFD